MKVAVGLFLLLVASTAQAFQLQSSNNHHPLVSLTHQPPLLDNNNPTTTTAAANKLMKKQSSYSIIINSPQNAATQINRIVNRNTKNRQNYFKCLFGAPHSTLRKDLIVGTNNSSNNKSVQRSLRQLGITIASTIVIVSRTRQGDVAHAAAAAAATPLVVTHPTGVGSTAITPLLSTTTSGGTSYSGLTLIPSAFSQIISGGGGGVGGVGVGGLSPAIGEIIMSFAYIILALGISHWLGTVAEGGHVKLMKLMAWTNLADGDFVDGGVESASSTKSTEEEPVGVGGMGIRGFIGRYVYMMQLIAHEITKAYRMGAQYRDSSVGVVESSSSIKSTTEDEQVKVKGTGIRGLIGRYTYMIQLIVHEVIKAYRMGDQSNKDKKLIPATAGPTTTTQEKDTMVDWSEYSNLIQQTSNKRKWKKQTSRWSKVVRNGGEMVYNKFAMMFERVANKSDVEGELLEVVVLCVCISTQKVSLITNFIGYLLPFHFVFHNRRNEKGN